MIPSLRSLGPALRVGLAATAIVFVVEFLVMLHLGDVGGRWPVGLVALADALLLVLLCAPLVWLLVVRPLRRREAAEHAHAQAAEEQARRVAAEYAVLMAMLDAEDGAADEAREDHEAIVVVDAGGTIRFVNRAFELTTGYSRAEALGKTPRILKSGRQGRRYYEEMWRTIAAGQSWRGVLINARKDGTTYATDLTITPLVGPDGRVTHFVGASRKIADYASS